MLCKSISGNPRAGISCICPKDADAKAKTKSRQVVFSTNDVLLETCVRVEEFGIVCTNAKQKEMQT